jgi:putative oxidoreductase
MQLLLGLLRTNADWAITLARVILGVVLFAHGAQMLLGWYGGAGYKHSIQVLTASVKLPASLAALVILTQFFGGLGLILGLLTRLAALGVLATMIGAVITVHYKFGFFMDWFGDREGHGFEYHLLAIALSIVIIANGAGALSLDRVVYEHQVRASLWEPAK